MTEDEIRAQANAEIRTLNPCKKCGVSGSNHLICFKGRYQVGCGSCDQAYEGFTYGQEAVNFWNLENPNE